MRVVADTNTIVSGLLWHGAPRRFLDAVRADTAHLYTSGVLLAELQDVLLRPKFTQRLQRAGVRPAGLIMGYAALATLIQPADIAPVIHADPDDDAVLACAVAAEAEAIVTGDRHLLELKRYRNIAILTAPELLRRLRGPHH